MSNALKLCLLLTVLFVQLDCEIYQDRPKIKTEDGDLILRAAVDKNIYILPNGPNSRVFIGNIDILHTNMSNSPSPNNPTPGATYPEDNGLNGILNRLSKLENLNVQPSMDILMNITYLRRRIIRQARRISRLEGQILLINADNKCESNPCKNGGTCLNLASDYHCLCPSNWEGTDCNTDVNECRNFAGTDLGCQNGAICQNKMGSYECLCRNGWFGMHCTRKAKDCSGGDFEMCGHGICLPVTSGDGIKCICNQGWTANGTGEACLTDVNECETKQGPRCSVNPKVDCINLPGSFRCGQCPAGYEGDGFSCSDIDECITIPNGGCSTSPMVECHNTVGSRICGPCPLGYQGDGKTCTWRGSCDINRGGCHPSAQCIENSASGGQPAQCICPDGMEGDGVGLNGCFISTLNNSVQNCANNPCGTHGQCHPLRSGYTCICTKGYVGAHCDSPLNHCSANACRNGGTCRPDEQSPRGFRCECTAQFSGDLCQLMTKTCGGVLDAEDGSIAYPPINSTSYNNNVRCAWVIHTTPDKVINVTFSKFNLEDDSDCVYDFLQIHDGRSSASQLIGRFCGNTFPKGGNIISSHNFLYFWFRSDHTVTKEGFSLHWNSIAPLCGGELDASKHGHISSPGSPGKYPPNRDCYWQLQTDLGKRIQLHFFGLDIESHTNCSFDYLAIYDGEHATDPLINKFCNSTQPGPIQSASSNLLIHFHSDAYSSGNGFQIVYAPAEGVPGCGGYFTEEKGQISSPSFNGKYLHNLLCEYKIKTSQDTKIHLKIKSFKLETSFKCQYDYLKIYDGPSPDNRLVGTFCGVNYIESYTSSSNYLYIKFKTDNSMAADGFVLTYESLCRQVFTGDSGIIKSPGYPFSYPENRVCEYIIQTDPGKSIQLSFQDFDIEDNRYYECKYDSIEIRDGLDSNSTFLGRYCGGSDHTPPVQTSTLNYMYLKFTSDLSVSGTGFLANYTTIVTNCGGIHKETSGIISYPVNSQEDYEDSKTCTWLLVAPEGMHIALTWNKFSIESMPSCQSDYVELTEIEYTNDFHYLGKFCGKVFPPALTTFSNRLQIKFVSDDSVEDAGFSVSYAFLDERKNCGGNFMRAHGYIVSPGWPEPYEPNRDCTWTISVPFGQQIMLNISLFDLERSVRGKCDLGDYVEIRNGVFNDSSLLGMYCGLHKPKIIKSIANSLFIHFHSDFYLSGKGFKIEWDSTITGCGGTLTSSSGSLSSPNYPQTYGNDAECFYRIITSMGSRILINFNDLDLEVSSNCRDDYIDVFDGKNVDAPRLGRYCKMSQVSGNAIKTSSNYAFIKFRTDFYIGGKGFLLNYHTVCQNNITGRYGAIESPDYPNNYPKNLECLWTVTVPRGNKINVTFTHFDIFRREVFYNRFSPSHYPLKVSRSNITGNCYKDYLQFKETHEDSFNNKLCGEVLPKSFTTNSNSLQIKFMTGSYFSHSGFRLEWVNNGCGGHIKKKYGSISLDKSLATNEEMECEWVIETDLGTSIQVDITALYVTDSKNCTVDAVEIYNGISIDSPLVTKVCHNGISIAHSSSNFILVRLVKKSNLKGTFFSFNFNGLYQTCGGRMIARSGTIHSKNYPQNYDNNINCIWYIHVPVNHRIELNFIDLDLYAETEENCEDNIKIYQSDYSFYSIFSSNYTNIICPNSNSTQIITKSNNLEIQFVTNGVGTAKGFKAQFSMICGATIKARYDGIITNDNVVNYLNNSCSWTIVAPKLDEKISLTITHMSLPKSVDFVSNKNCPASYLKIYDGDDELAPIIDEFCGRKVPPMIVSHGNSITIKFGTYADTLVGKFSAHYSRTKTSCGGSLSSEEGYIASPNYPQSYPPNTNCEWFLNTSPGNKVYISFEQFDIDYSENCNEDYVEVREINGSGRLIGVFCGTEIPSNTTAASKLYVKLHSDSKNNGRGFTIKYGFVHGNDIFGIEKGEIASPLYPHSYDGAADYSWRVSYSGSNPILLSINRLEIPVQGPSCYNYLAIYDGYDETSDLIEKLCGLLPNKKKSIITSSSIVYLKLVLDETNPGSSFHLNWAKNDIVEDTAENKLNCGSKTSEFVLPTRSLQFHSPNYPKFYNDSLNCKWAFQTAADRHLVLKFKDFKLEESVNCFADYVTVETSNTGTEWSMIKEKMCLTSLSTNTIVGKSYLSIAFKSDYGVTERGFKAEVSSLCGGFITALSGTISPTWDDWKNIFKSDNKCNWIIKVRPGKTIALKFDHFNITNNDECLNYVTIRNGNSDESPLLKTGKYCGDVHENKSTIISSSNAIHVTYSVIRRSVFQNFILRFEEKSVECGLTSQLDSNHPYETINSPNFPSISAPYSECVWLFTGPPGEILRIDFIKRFDLSSKDYCAQEFIEVRDGTSDISPLIGTYCGKKPGTIKTSGNLAYIKYVTQIPEPGNGFMANVSIDVCGGTIRAAMGEVSSPGYPHMQFLPDGSICEWMVIGTHENVFKIVLQDISLPQPKTYCGTKIMIEELISDTNTTNVIKTYCSDDDYKDQNGPIETSQNTFKVKLIIGKSSEWQTSNKKGFRLTFNSSRPTCGGTITMPEGYLTTPGYPRETSIRYCHWMIIVPNKTRRVKLEILDSELDINSHQSRMGIFNDLNFQVAIQTFRENNVSLTNKTFESSGNTMSLYILLLQRTSHRFKAKFSSDEEALCGGSLVGINGTLLSPLLERSYTCEWNYNPFNNEVSTSQITVEPEYTTIYIEGTFGTTSRTNANRCQLEHSKLNIQTVFTNRGLMFNRDVCATTDVSFRIPSATIQFKAAQANSVSISFSLTWKLYPCGGVIHVNESPFNIINIPEGYNNSIECAWMLISAIDNRISIALEGKFSLSCNDEFIKISDSFQYSTTIGDYCKDRSQVNPITTNRNVYLQYHSKAKQNRTIKIIVQKSRKPCGGYLTKYDPIFSSPNYPYHYFENTECVWEIQTDPSTRVSLVFIDRFVIESSSNCTKDAVIIYDWINNTYIEIARICGREVPTAPINSTSNKMKVMLRTDSDINLDGFRARWKSICGSTLIPTEKEQFLYSPGYPLEYTGLLDCTYKITSNNGQKIDFKVLDFELEGTYPNCDFDNFTLTAGGDQYFFYPTYCGIEVPPSSNKYSQITIAFKTDRYVHRKGFKISYKIYSCGQVILSPTIIISGPKSDSGINFNNCTWYIEAPPNKIAVFKLFFLDTESSDQCTFDFIAIYNGHTIDENKRLALLCGLINTTAVIYSTDRKMLVQFVNDESIYFTSFRAEVFFTLSEGAGCGGQINLKDSNYIKSPMLPGNVIYENYLDCVWTITAPRDSIIRIEFTTFHLASCDNINQTAIGFSKCDCDFIEIKDGLQINGLEIGKYCGHTLPPTLVSSSNIMSIRISTDGEIASSGFEARLRKENSICGKSTFKITNNVQRITSPGYDSQIIPRGIRCAYHLEPDLDYGTIHIKIINLDLNRDNINGETECHKDKIILTSKATDFNSTLFNKDFIWSHARDPFFSHINFYEPIHSYPQHFELCTVNKSIDFYLRGTVMMIVQTSPEEDLRHHKGVEIEVRMTGFCGKNYTGTQGRIQANIEYFNERRDCNTLITAPENHTISVYFLTLLLNSGQDINYLDFYDGKTKNSPKIAHFASVSVEDFPVFSTGRYLLMHHQKNSDDISLYDLNYVTSDKGQGCGGHLYNHVGRVSSPLYPQVYRRHASCEWGLETPPGTRVLLHFAVFDLGRACDTNYVELRDRSGKTISTFCSETPADFTSSSNYVKIVFFTTVNNGGVGWVADFTAIV